ncbi:hypothetical protein IC582_016959 [Cucumis melo]
MILSCKCGASLMSSSLRRLRSLGEGLDRERERLWQTSNLAFAVVRELQNESLECATLMYRGLRMFYAETNTRARPLTWVSVKYRMWVLHDEVHARHSKAKEHYNYRSDETSTLYLI